MDASTSWEAPPAWDDLSPRQQMILLGLARGLSNREIGDELGISYNTVRNILYDLYEVLGLSNRVQALLWVMRHEDIAVKVLARI